VKSSTTRLIVIGVVLALALWKLWPTVTFYQLNGERESFKAAKDSVGLHRWDSIHSEDYRAALSNRIKLGLDLRGGIYIAMEVDAPALLLESAQREAVDEPFQEAIKATADEARLSDDPVIDIFVKNFDKYVRPTGKTLLDYYDVGTLGSDASDDAIVKQLSRNIDDAVDQAVEVVRQRIDKYGVAEPTIQKQGGRRIIVELPGADNEQEIRGLLQTTARLEFKLVRDGSEVVELFQKIDAALAGKVVDSTTVAKIDSAAAADSTAVAKTDSTAVAKADSTAVAKADSTATADSNTVASADSTRTDTAAGDTNDPYKGLSDQEKAKRYIADHPFSTLFQTYYRPDNNAQGQDATGIYGSKQIPTGVYDFYTSKAAESKINQLLNRPEVRRIMPDSILIAFTAHSEMGPNKETDPAKIGVQLFVLKRDPELTGDVVTNARPNFDPQTGKPMVEMEMNADGAERWSQITGRNIHKRVAIVLDSSVYSAPVIQTKISGGSSQITGSQSINESTLLAVVLKAGALKAPVKIIEERLVGPSLGEDSIRQGINATLMAALVVILFMAVYYAFGGVVADLAVMLNVLFTLAVLSGLNATLTLPGIGGIVLTIGMAVDANVLIYERIREEMSRGRTLKSAVEVGYKKAFAAIIDSNITTFLTGAILYVFGTGPIQGFAVTLMIGIISTLFTAVFITRVVFELMLDRGAASISFGQPKNATA